MNIEQRPEGLVKLTGTIENYRVTRAEASFMFSDADRTRLGVVAIAAGVAGLSGQAIATASYATSAEEDADYVEFDLDGKPIKGWVWRSPFKKGDAVEVAAEWRDDHYETAGIARPADRIIALYPHCSQGKIRHIKNAARAWLLGTAGMLGFSTSFMVVMMALAEVAGAQSFTEENGFATAVSMVSSMSYFILTMLIWFLYGTPIATSIVLYVLFIGCLQLVNVAGLHDLVEGALWVGGGIYAFFGLMTISLARKWMPFVRLTEKVCRTLGIPHAGNVDLVKSSKAQRKPDDPGEYGTFYFRY